MIEPPELAIVGGGIAGAAAALRASQYSLPAVWVTGSRDTSKRSRVRWVANVDNMIGVHPDLVLDQLRRRWKKSPELIAALDALPQLHISTQDLVDNARARVAAEGSWVRELAGEAVAARRTPDGFSLEVVTREGTEVVHAHRLLLATGVMDVQPHIAKRRSDGEVDLATRWIYPFANHETVLYCIRCEGHLTRERRAAVIGSSETAGQIALMLAERYGSCVAVLLNGEEPAFDSGTARLLADHGIAVHPARITDCVDLEGAPRGTLGAVELEDGTRLELAYAFVALGLYRIYNDLAVQLGAELEDGEEPAERRHVLVEPDGRTTVPGLFAIGDMTQRRDERVMKQIYTCQEYAVRAVDAIERGRRSRLRKARLSRLGEG